MTASGSFSSVASPPERPRVALPGSGLLPPLPEAFLAGRDLDLLEPLRLASSPEDLAAAPPAVDRGALAAALETANDSYGHPAAAELAGRLADPATRVIVTGQQPGLLGGPLYTLSKAVAAALWARRLEEAGERAVAVFWVGTEDHDFREVSRGIAPAPGGPLELDLGEDPAPLMPVGMRTLGPAVEGVLERLREAVPGERYAAWLDRVAGWYRPEARFGEAFCRLLAGLLGERCPLLLDAMLPAVKAAERPWLRRIVEERGAVEAAYAERDARIAERGHTPQVNPQPGASPLFLLHGRTRRRIEWPDGGRLRLRGEPPVERDVDWLLAAIEENPGAVSPGVTARAAIQDAILGSSGLVLGPGEMSYMPQVAPLYALLGVPPPRLLMRPQALVLGSHELDKLGAVGLDLADLVKPGLDLDRALAGGRERDLVGPARGRILAELEGLEQDARAVDPSLEGPSKKTRGQIERALEAFSGKVAAALARRDAVDRKRAEDLQAACRPLGTLQERAVFTAHFPGKYGDRLVDAFFEQLALEPDVLQVIVP